MRLTVQNCPKLARLAMPDMSYGSIPPGNVSPREDPSATKFAAVFLATLLIGPLNFVIYKIMFTAYGEANAFFVSQGINALYVIYGGVALYWVERQGKITHEMTQIPKYKFAVMGLLDCCGGFLAAMGATNTSGSLQQLLNQSLIPCTMLASWLFLNKHSTVRQQLGAFVIFLGVLVVLLPSFATPANSSLISNVVYFTSNIPLACSFVYKEIGFKNLKVHVIYLTQMVSIYQLLWGFLFAPLQLIPGIGVMESWEDIFTNFYSGFLCFIQWDSECASHGAFLLLTGYCVVNFVFNTSGLYLVKKGSAVWNSITYALILPLTVLAFNLPILGIYTETFSYYTFAGLLVVLCGFLTWRSDEIFVEDATLLRKNTILSDEESLFEVGSVRAKSVSSPVRIRSTNPFDEDYDPFEPVSRVPDTFYDRVIVLSIE